MRTLTIPKTILTLVALAATASPLSRLASWSSCSDDLDSLKSAASDASDAAHQARNAEDDLESCTGESGCRSARSEYEDAKDKIEGELDDVASKIRSVTNSCGVDLTAPKTPCELLHRYQRRFSPEVVLQLCKGSMSDAECKKCLGLK
jgi:hypothetical protein